MAVDRRVKTPVSVVYLSSNKKIGPMSATYAGQQTCAEDCPLRGRGCYAEGGALKFTTGQRNDVAAAAGLSPVESARIEAAGIRALAARPLPLDLRVHVVGDCPDDASAAIVGAAMADYEAATGRKAWTYTHAWRTVQRASWGTAHVLASCETAADVVAARERGYAAAIVTEEHPADGRAYAATDAVKVIPCPNQTRGVQCKDCLLCSRELPAAIGFAVHGQGAETAREVVRSRSQGR